MAISASYDFAHTRTQAIEHALRLCGVLREGVSASANQLTTGAIALNTVIKAFHATGMPLWVVRKAAVFPVENDHDIALGLGGGHAASTWTHTQLSAAAASGATTITVDSITGISASDNIGVEIDDGTIHWTTVSGAPSGSTVTLAVALDGAAGIDSHVYVYTTKMIKPLKVIKAMTYNYTDDTEREINVLSRDEYTRFSDKTIESAAITDVYFEPAVGSTATFFIYPRFANGDSIIQIWSQMPFSDIDSATDTLDFPQEWESAVVWELAAVLGPENGVPDRKMNMITQKALYEKTKVEEFGQEEGSVYIMPARR